MNAHDNSAGSEMAPTAPAATTRPPRDLFHHAEQAVYIAVGAMLAIAAVIGLVSAGFQLWEGATHWTETEKLFETIDRLLFVLMLVEIMHTVSVSIRTGTLTVQPFLVVGLIATIRRVLMITLETSEYMNGQSWSDSVQSHFYASLVELGVLSWLIVVMIGSIFLLHRMGQAERER